MPGAAQALKIQNSCDGSRFVVYYRSEYRKTCSLQIALQQNLDIKNFLKLSCMLGCKALNLSYQRRRVITGQHRFGPRFELASIGPQHLLLDGQNL